jgi:dihydrofolate reductase
MSVQQQHRIPTAVIAAMSLNRVIGRDGKLPWRLASDLKRFRQETWGKPVIVGRRTFDDIGRPLPGRTLVVLSSSAPTATGVLHARSFAEALAVAAEAAAELGASEIMVAGGSAVYPEALRNARRLLLTVVETRTEGDAFFPDADLDLWREYSRYRLPAGPQDEFATTAFDYRR